MSHYLTITDLFQKLPLMPNGNDVPAIPFPALQFSPYEVEGRSGVAVHMLYDTRVENPNGPSAALVKYEAGALTPRHVHPGWELVLVLEGELIDDRGAHPAGTLQIYPPASSHELKSLIGCKFLVVWEQPVRSPD